MSFDGQNSLCLFKHPRLSSPGLTGRSSTPQPIRSSTAVSKILDAPFSRSMTAESVAGIFQDKFQDKLQLSRGRDDARSLWEHHPLTGKSVAHRHCDLMPGKLVAAGMRSSRRPSSMRDARTEATAVDGSFRAVPERAHLSDCLDVAERLGISRRRPRIRSRTRFKDRNRHTRCQNEAELRRQRESSVKASRA